MAKVLIIGAHGKVALRLAPQLTARGDEVTGVIRNADHAADIAAIGATPLVADVERLDTAGIAEILRGHDVVVWSAGAGGGNPPRTYAVDRDAAIRSIDAASDAGVRRYVMVSYLGSRLDHGLPEDHFFFPYAEAKAAADEYLRATDLDWTILAPGPLTLDEPTGLIEVADPGEGRVSRADVASVIAATLVEPRTLHRTIEFGNGATPIAEAIAG
ncbi:SDR family oxidoreductase [Microbacterium sp. NIBRBAC000506063]|uniref:SDR family oxidoreductase n=1 Tax=Microbacterium sp. NIBRBAC000506063 TaxID=2734618 RepID=UPI001BB48AB1|nr:SDR family oxidoreductase [Microbacterium sp. NIBRBAC000506063]QTV80416.1 SDR family oxidoreductase [Microbacterium sp. NIBRBAC000506063]